ncbi:MAG: hypothetical protein IJ150_09225 [Bacteroidales bacterium]|nr:hypothetical protein [Bacteroidales bacterium]
MAQLIANPIYDSAFKYMMQNERAATILLENLLDKEILKLDILTNDTPIVEESGVRILRLDFSAKVKDRKTSETELITIELQKSYLDTEIMRFRTYLGQQYSDVKKSDTELVKTWRKNKKTGQIESVEVEKHNPLHIVAIYILGHTFQEIDVPKPVIYNYPNPRDIENALVPDVLKTRFFRGITHDTIIVQIPYLKKNAQTKLEQMLEIFCQDYISNGSEQLLEFDDFDHRSNEFKELARPLVFAVSDPKLRKVMTIEDEMSIHFQNVKYVTDENEALHTMMAENRKRLLEQEMQIQQQESQLQQQENQLQQKNERLKQQESQLQQQENQLQQKNERLQQQESQLQQQENQLQQKNERLQQQESQLQQKNEQLQATNNQLASVLSASVKAFSTQGLSPEEIANILNLSVEDILKLL